MVNIAHNSRSQKIRKNQGPSCYMVQTSRFAKSFKVCNIEHLVTVNRCKMQHVKTKDLTVKQILSVPCTTCGAAIGEVCELNSGSARSEPHRDRKLSATETVEKEKRRT